MQPVRAQRLRDDVANHRRIVGDQGDAASGLANFHLGIGRVLLSARARQQHQLGGFEHQRKRTFFQVYGRRHQRESFEELAHGFEHDLAFEMPRGSRQRYEIGTALRDDDACAATIGPRLIENLAQIEYRHGSAGKMDGRPLGTVAVLDGARQDQTAHGGGRQRIGAHAHTKQNHPGDGHLDVEGGSATELGSNVNLAAHVFHHVEHDVEPDAASGNLGDLVAGRETRGEEGAQDVPLGGGAGNHGI